MDHLCINAWHDYIGLTKAELFVVNVMDDGILRGENMFNDENILHTCTCDKLLMIMSRVRARIFFSFATTFANLIFFVPISLNLGYLSPLLRKSY